VQQPVAGRGDETEGPAPVGAALGVAMVELVAKADPAVRKLLGRVERPLARIWLAAWWPAAPAGTVVEPNCKIGPYRVDFLIVPRLVVEIDGDPPSAATRDQVVRRDADDATVASFLEAADGVLHLDSSGLDLDQTVDAVLGVVARQAGLDGAALVGKDLLVGLADEPVGAGRGA